MATITSTQARWIGNTNGRMGGGHTGGPGIDGIQEAASQTFSAGAPVRPDATSGQIEIAADGDAVTSLYGQAMEAATGTTAAACYVRLWKAGDLVVMNLESNGAGVATALGQIGDAVNFNVVSSKLHADVLPGGSAAVATVASGVIRDIYCTEHGYPDGDALGDTNGRVVVELVGSMFLGRSL